MLYLITVVVAFCSLTYELLLAETLSQLLENTVLRYSVTVGVYLAAMGVGAILCRPGRASANRLLKVQLPLSVIGGLAVFAIHAADAFHRYLWMAVPFFQTDPGAALIPISLLVVSHAMIVVIGVLSGYALPLLIAMARRRRAGTQNLVLGFDYFGALLASVAFPLLLLPRLGVLALAYVTGLVNVAACVLLLVSQRTRRSLRVAGRAAAAAAILLLLLALTPNTEQFFLKKFYFFKNLTSVSALLSSWTRFPDVETYRSPYQRIHLVTAPDDALTQAIHARYSTKFSAEPEFPRHVLLFLNERWQMFTDVEEFYHEFFAHVPVQFAGHPRRVLVLGGGDGLLAREILKYAAVEAVTLVELDERMIELATHHPVLARANHDALADPRLTVAIGDAFEWVAADDGVYDAIWIDFPFPVNYDLARLYSVEFYSLVRQRLAPGGFIALDVDTMAEPDQLDVYYGTLQAAGFRDVVPFATRLETDNEQLADLREHALAYGQYTGVDERGYPMVVDDAARMRAAFEERLRGTLAGLEHRFVLARLEHGGAEPVWTEPGVPLHVLNEERFQLALEVPPPRPFDPNAVNSIFQPTLPDLEFFRIKSPWW